MVESAQIAFSHLRMSLCAPCPPAHDGGPPGGQGGAEGAPAPAVGDGGAQPATGIGQHQPKKLRKLTEQF